MEVKLTFNLPDEQSQYNVCIDGMDNWQTLWDLDQRCRSSLKHGHGRQTPDEVFEFVREFISERVNFERVV